MYRDWISLSVWYCDICIKDLYHIKKKRNKEKKKLEDERGGKRRERRRKKKKSESLILEVGVLLLMAYGNLTPFSFNWISSSSCFIFYFFCLHLIYLIVL